MDLISAYQLKIKVLIMPRPKGTGKIDSWLESLTADEQDQFRRYCRDNFHNKSAIHAYLISNGCEVGLTTVYSWVPNNILPGEQAILINHEASAYVGLEIRPLLEKLLASLNRITGEFNNRLIGEAMERISPEKCAELLPQYAREMRAVASQINQIQQTENINGLVMGGASRVAEIVMGMNGVKDTPDESFIRKTIEAAMLQLHEEISRTKVVS
ncbi:hypothetical protein K9N68_37215 (plasmid) [Kovacikia minuta CCNUW1]|uniref:hypothetical protein n=1 Tax=Kovacikia minuta TaxID=2931930 RepID=UPI001CCBFCAD|nr:hypothetical protein [Kovacikia minuta]UBF29853.1 hypothetical protein K9N68_37215 [Kovacikia minuta CCNUW1]